MRKAFLVIAAGCIALIGFGFGRPSFGDSDEGAKVVASATPTPAAGHERVIAPNGLPKWVTCRRESDGNVVVVNYGYGVGDVTQIRVSPGSTFVLDVHVIEYPGVQIAIMLGGTASYSSYTRVEKVVDSDGHDIHCPITEPSRPS